MNERGNSTIYKSYHTVSNKEFKILKGVAIYEKNVFCYTHHYNDVPSFLF